MKLPLLRVHVDLWKAYWRREWFYFGAFLRSLR